MLLPPLLLLLLSLLLLSVVLFFCRSSPTCTYPYPVSCLVPLPPRLHVKLFSCVAFDGYVHTRVRCVLRAFLGWLP